MKVCEREKRKLSLVERCEREKEKKARDQESMAAKDSLINENVRQTCDNENKSFNS